MNFIDVKEAVVATGKSEKTIRRFLSKEASKPYLNNKNGKILVEVNYLFSSFPAVGHLYRPPGHSLDIDQPMSMDIQVMELQNKIALYEQEIKHKNQIIEEKEGRISDLQKAMLMIGSPQMTAEKKKKWWQF